MERAEAAQLEAQAASDEYDEFAPPPKEEDVLAGMDLSGMSKKEIKKLRQKEEKKRDKMAAKAAKKAARKAEMDEDLVVGGVPGEGLESSDLNGNAAVEDIDVSNPQHSYQFPVLLSEHVVLTHTVCIISNRRSYPTGPSGPFTGTGQKGKAIAGRKDPQGASSSSHPCHGIESARLFCPPFGGNRRDLPRSGGRQGRHVGSADR
jgi:hypothetical protein